MPSSVPAHDDMGGGGVESHEFEMVVFLVGNATALVENVYLWAGCLGWTQSWLTPPERRLCLFCSHCLKTAKRPNVTQPENREHSWGLKRNQGSTMGVSAFFLVKFTSPGVETGVLSFLKNGEQIKKIGSQHRQ